jgi:glutathione synthase/RimK-type ligase-like ATP-grasp enzyme
MKAFLLRRRKLGNTSCKEIVKQSKTGIAVFRNDAKLPSKAQYDICIRWGCTSNVEQKTVLNKAEAIHAVANKTEFRQLLSQHKLAPRTYTNADLVNGVVFDLPVVVRPAVHHQGRHLFMCRTQAEFKAAIAKCGIGWYAAPFFDKVAEYRVFCLQGRALAVAKKTPGNPKDVAWNVAQGGRFDNVRWDEWPLKAVKNSLKAFGLSGLDFGGVDIMVDNDGNTFVLEINSAPSLTSPYRQECFAKGFDWVCVNGKDTIPLTEEKGGYRKFIHPAVCPTAIV